MKYIIKNIAIGDQGVTIAFSQPYGPFGQTSNTNQTYPVQATPKLGKLFGLLKDHAKSICGIESDKDIDVTGINLSHKGSNLGVKISFKLAGPSGSVTGISSPVEFLETTGYENAVDLAGLVDQMCEEAFLYIENKLEDANLFNQPKQKEPESAKEYEQDPFEHKDESDLDNAGKQEGPAKKEKKQPAREVVVKFTPNAQMPNDAFEEKSDVIPAPEKPKKKHAVNAN